MKKQQMLYVSKFNNRNESTIQRTDPLLFSVAGLDPPLILYFPRLVMRTFLRLFRLVLLVVRNSLEKFSSPKTVLSGGASVNTGLVVNGITI